jgi:hypothetical protein
MQERHCRLAQAPIGFHGEVYKAVASGLHSGIGRLLLPVPMRGRCPCCSNSAGKGVKGGGVDDGNVRDGDALGHGEDDLATSLDLDGGSVRGSAGACGQAGKAAKCGLKGEGDARPVHSTLQNPFQDVMAQC